MKCPGLDIYTVIKIMFEQVSYNLRVHGYAVIPEFFKCSPETLQFMKRRKRYAKPVFNPDKKRGQVKITPDVILQHKLVSLVEGLSTFLSVGQASLISSSANCQRQRMHTDYEPRQMEGLEDSKIPLSAILAIEAAGSSLYVNSYNTKIHFSQGDLLLFRGDTLHAGSDYIESNLRIHWYINSIYVYKPANIAYFRRSTPSVRRLYEESNRSSEAYQGRYLRSDSRRLQTDGVTASHA